MKKVYALIFCLTVLSFYGSSQTYNDSTLRLVSTKDATARDAAGKLQTLPANDHLYRADVYAANRQFSQAREHWQKVLDNYPADAGVSRALFGMGRSFMWEREYSRAIPYFARVADEFPSLKDGREGLAFQAACNVRLGRHADAAKLYELYTVKFPTGEKIDSAYLNLIDAYRESGKYVEADNWVTKTVQRFTGTPAQTNALHARLRMDIFRQSWPNAIRAADELLRLNSFSKSMAGADEVRYLKAFAIEKSGRKNEALAIYSQIPSNIQSYYSGLAAEKTGDSGFHVRTIAQVRRTDFPLLFRTEILINAKKKKIDPRFVLAIMNQESSFRPNAKSQSAARGLLQLTYDTALKYNKQAGFPTLKPDELYQPVINIAIGCEYIADLKDQFGGLYEAIAASYNGGEDNVLRWLNRSQPREPGIFVSEIGFAESKDYVAKVMRNYRVYRELYDENLIKK